MPAAVQRKKSICATCKTEFEHYATKKRKFCSRKCLKNFDYPGSFWTGKNGYLYYRKGRGKKILVHRIVAGIKDSRIVHHKDGNKLNNSLDNLEILKCQADHLKIHNPVVSRWEKWKKKQAK